jgi:hypothetical protein
VAVDLDGNVLVAGAAAEGEPTAEGPPPSAVLLVKLDPQGTEQWRLRFGSGGIDGALALAADPGGNIVLSGGFTSRSIEFGGPPVQNRIGRDTFLAKLSPSGRHIWSRSLGARPEGLALATDASGNVIVAGTTVGSADFGGGIPQDPAGTAGAQRVIVAKLAPSGAQLWSRRFGGRTGAAAYAAAVDSAGAVVLTGSFVTTVDFGGGGPLGGADGGVPTTFALKLDRDGRHVWSRAFGRGRGRGIALDPAGGVAIVGEMGPAADFGAGPLAGGGGLDLLVARLDAGGATLWAQGFGDEDDQRARQVTIDPAGRVLVTGEFQGSMNLGGGALANRRGEVGGRGDIVLAAFDRDGVHVWSRRFGDAADDQSGTGVAVDAGGDLLLAGWFASTVDLGGGTFATGGRVTPGATWGSAHAGFIAKFRP